MAWLDGIPVGPLVLFGLGYLALLGLVLLFVRSRRPRCERCGGAWRMTAAGNAFHVCVKPEREYP